VDKCKKFAYSTHLLLNILTIINILLAMTKLYALCAMLGRLEGAILLIQFQQRGLFAFSAFLESSSSWLIDE
jgi:hypothetical protein